MRAALEAAVDTWAPRLLDLSHAIHARPELAYQEHFAHDAICDLLAEGGLTVQRGAYGLPTAFRAEAGSGQPTIAVLCEYDALPEIGHACGHNVIAAAGAGAAIAAAALAERCGGKVVALGCPAEEGGAGKVALIEAGAFDDIDAAMMIHAADADLTSIDAIAIHEADVVYSGRASHAAAAPEMGRNALDAAVLGYMNIAALRQHIASDERVHGIFTESGTAANVVPDRTRATWYVRSPTLAGLEALKSRVVACIEAGAAAAGCEVEISWPRPAYADMRDNQALLACFAANAERLGRPLQPPGASRVVGSTDMGNVSHVVPSIHPMLKAAPPGVAIHTKAFCEHSAAASGDATVIDGAKAMALTVGDLWMTPSLIEQARSEHSV